MQLDQSAHVTFNVGVVQEWNLAAQPTGIGHHARGFAWAVCQSAYFQQVRPTGQPCDVSGQGSDRLPLA
jgi:hypothetical protein